MFFFSSRRRHTRWTGDWSSDVCSSDLRVGGDRRGGREAAERVVIREPGLPGDRRRVAADGTGGVAVDGELAPGGTQRVVGEQPSEQGGSDARSGEGRVGEEGRGAGGRE